MLTAKTTFYRGSYRCSDDRCPPDEREWQRTRYVKVNPVQVGEDVITRDGKEPIPAESTAGGISKISSIALARLVARPLGGQSLPSLLHVRWLAQ